MGSARHYGSLRNACKRYLRAVRDFMQRAAVGDTQFLRSMIPHHSGAILMCERASLTRLEIQALCRQSVASQKAEFRRWRHCSPDGEEV